MQPGRPHAQAVAIREARIAAARMRLINDPSILGAPLDADGADVELRALFRG